MLHKGLCIVKCVAMREAASIETGSGPALSAGPLFVAGILLGVVGDALLRVGGPPGVNMSLWVAAITLSAYVLQRRGGPELNRERVAWLAITVLFAAGL